MQNRGAARCPASPTDPVSALDNPRHERFVQGLLAGKSADDAYAAAGFRPHRGNASRLRANEHVVRRLAELQAAVADSSVITAVRVLDELAKLAFSNMLDYMRVGPDGDPVLDFSKLTRDQAAALVEVTVEDFVDAREPPSEGLEPQAHGGGLRRRGGREVRRVKFKLADKRAPLVDLGRYLGLFKDGKPEAPKDAGELKEVSDLEAARRIAFLLHQAAQAAQAKPEPKKDKRDGG
jgi:phage terminase small subunit